MEQELELKELEQNEMNWNWKIVNLNGIERFWIKLKAFEFIWNWIKKLSIWYFCDAVKDILQIVGSIAVHAMVFNDQEKLDSEAAGQTLHSNLWVDETDEWDVN